MSGTKLTYNIKGMSCGSCVSKVKSALEAHEWVQHAEVNLETETALLEVERTPGIGSLQKALNNGGNYTISNHIPGEIQSTSEVSAHNTESFKPLIIIFLYLIAVTNLPEIVVYEKFDFSRWMRHFMAGFFIVFSFFKMLDIPAFAKSFAMYDILAKRSNAYAFTYPFIELFLGLAYLIDLAPVITNVITLIVMGVGSIGVILAVRRRDRIQCACLGTVFKLPMTTVTIVEDLLMLVMAATMLWLHLS